MFKIGDFSKLARVSVNTLRHYDRLHLLRPAWIDRYSSYRYYTAGQLGELNRILALKDLGFSLEQIRQLLGSNLQPSELRGLLRLKQSELERLIDSEQRRLDRVDERLRQIEQDGNIPSYDVVLKPVSALPVIGLRQVIPAFSQLTELFEELGKTGI